MEQQILRMIAQVCDEPAILEHPETELLESELLNSLALITLLTSLEDMLGVELQPTQLPRETWCTPASIIAAVCRELETI